MPVIPLNDYLTFQSWSWVHKNEQRQFSALCGDNPPTITSGYGKWTIIDRPLRQGVTVPTGFDPAKLQIEVRFGIWDGRFGFDGWDTSPTAAGEVEQNIDDLHWMAGGNFEAGPSPIVYVDAYSGQTGERINLVPFQYRRVSWIIDGGVDWGKSLREPSTGSRIYQEATFSLTGFLGLGITPPKEQGSLAGGYFRTTRGIRTIMAIAASPTSRSPGPFWENLAFQIRDAPQNDPCKGSRLSLRRRSITHFQLPVGLEVWVPGHMI